MKVESFDQSEAEVVDLSLYDERDMFERIQARCTVCGRRAVLVAFKTRIGYYYFVRCSKCHYNFVPLQIDPEEAIRLWNKGEPIWLEGESGAEYREQFRANLRK